MNLVRCGAEDKDDRFNICIVCNLDCLLRGSNVFYSQLKQLF